MRRLGDVLLATALIRSVRRAWPQARLEVLVNAGSAGVLQGNPDIDVLHVQPERAKAGQLWQLARTLWRRYDLAISALYNDRPHLWALVASAHRAGAVSPEGHAGWRWKRWSCEVSVPVDLGEVHTVEQYLRIADALGIPRVAEVVLPRPQGAGIVVDGDYAVLHPSPLYRYKQWTVAGWRAVIDELVDRGLRVVLSGGSAAAERALMREIAAGLSAERVAQVTMTPEGRPIAELTPLLEGARLYIGPDTSVTHLAAASGTPTIAIFGPSPTFSWGPWPVGRAADAGDTPWRLKAPLQHEGNVWLIQGEGDCVPCLGEGCERRLDSPSRCLDELDPQRVIAVVREILGERAYIQSTQAPVPSDSVAASATGTSPAPVRQA